jgi:pimeloyl-ACP methyl ester carboxylesterase
MWSQTLFRFSGAAVFSLSFAASVQTQTVTPNPTATQERLQGQKTAESDYGKFEKVFSFLRARNAKQFAIDPAKGIDEASYVPIGGIPQWITIRGEDRANPVLLFVHGGPGDVTNPWTFVLFAPWEKYFTVVQWDERGAGRTLRKNGPGEAPSMTLDRMAQDGVEVAAYLVKHVGKEKIGVVAHSFGTILALRMVQAKPDIFYAYVGTGEVADATRNYAVAYDALLRKAEATKNQDARDDLRRVGPPPYKSGEGYGVQRKWANRFEGADEFLPGTIGLTLVAPGGSVADLNDSFEGQGEITEGLVNRSRSAQPKDLGLDFAVPVFFFQGDEDFTTPTALARDYLALIRAPKKEFVPIKGGHFAVFMNSSDFLKELLGRVRPLAVESKIPTKKK